MAYIFLFRNYHFKYILTPLRYKSNIRYKPSSLELTIIEKMLFLSELSVLSMDTFPQYMKYTK